MSDDTEIIEKKPFIKAVIDYFLDKLGHIVAVTISTAIAASISSCHHKETNDNVKVIWEHIADKQAQIDELKGK